MKRTSTTMSSAALELEVSVRTTYGGIAPAAPRPLKGFVEIKVLSSPPANDVGKMTYMVLLDKSSSMADGERYGNMLQGFRALHALLAPTQEPMVVIPFNHTADDVFVGPFTPENLSLISDNLRPNGGTNISAALTKAYDLIAQQPSDEKTSCCC